MIQWPGRSRLLGLIAVTTQDSCENEFTTALVQDTSLISLKDVKQFSTGYKAWHCAPLRLHIATWPNMALRGNAVQCGKVLSYACHGHASTALLIATGLPMYSCTHRVLIRLVWGANNLPI